MTDTDNLLDRCRLELGDPEAEFRVRPGRFWAKLGLGLALILYGVAANYLWWVHGPQRIDHLVLLLLFGPPVTGLSLLLHLYRTRGLCVLVYPTGLFRVQRGEFESYPWAEIEEIRLQADKATIERERDERGEAVAYWLAVEPPALRLGNASLTLRRRDGTTGTLTPSLSGYAELIELVQRATFRFLWPPAVTRFRAGETLEFGPFQVSGAGLRFNGTRLTWLELGGVNVGGKHLAIKRPGKWLPWVMHELAEIPNPHIFLALIEEARRFIPSPPPPPRSD